VKLEDLDDGEDGAQLLGEPGAALPRVEELRDDLPVPSRQDCGLLALPRPRRHRILPVLVDTRP
jgi:hypothetical protein